jgi:hypothetical protein
MNNKQKLELAWADKENRPPTGAAHTGIRAKKQDNPFGSPNRNCEML